MHVLFSTKGRKKSIPPKVQEPLWAHIVSFCKKDRITIHAVGGTSDHIHLLLEHPPTVSTDDLVLNIQEKSSQWMKGRVPGFAWQEGYGACSIGKSEVMRLAEYIRNQEQIHATMTYEEEFIRFLEENQIEYDPEDVFG
jgi:REP element-mobilizing transposase RayT